MCQAEGRNVPRRPAAGSVPPTRVSTLDARRPGGEKRGGPRPWGLGPGGLRAQPSDQANDVRGFGSAVARSHIEFHLFAFMKSTEPIAFDRRVVNEDLLLAFRGDKAISTLVTEPLDGATGHESPSLSGRVMTLPGPETAPDCRGRLPRSSGIPWGRFGAGVTATRG